MPKIKIQKQLLWDVRSKEFPDRHNFVLVAIDNRTESNKTEQKVKEKIQPTEGVRSETRKINKTCNLSRTIRFTSYRKSIDDIEWKEIYQGRIKRDTNLYERQKKGILENYIDCLASSGKLSE